MRYYEEPTEFTQTTPDVGGFSGTVDYTGGSHYDQTIDYSIWAYSLGLDGTRVYSPVPATTTITDMTDVSFQVFLNWTNENVNNGGYVVQAFVSGPGGGSWSGDTGYYYKDVGNVNGSAALDDEDGYGSGYVSDGWTAGQFTPAQLSPYSYDYSGWADVGGAPVSSGPVGYDSLAINSSGVLYVAYSDGNNSNEATVEKFDGTNWIPVGSPVSPAEADYISLVISPTGTPYIAYADTNNSYAATVEEFNGTSWVEVGSALPSNTSLEYDSLAISPTGTPYLAYSDGNNTNAATVYEYTNGNWVRLGSTLSSNTSYESLAIDSSGNVYLAYSDGNNYVIVQKYDSNSGDWTEMGSMVSASTLGPTQYISLAVDQSSGAVYLAFSDENNNNEALVQKYDSSTGSWV